MKYLLILTVLACFGNSDNNSSRGNSDSIVFKDRGEEFDIIQEFHQDIRRRAKDYLGKGVENYVSLIDKFFASKFNEVSQGNDVLKLIGKIELLDEETYTKIRNIIGEKSWQKEDGKFTSIKKALPDMGESEIKASIMKWYADEERKKETLQVKAGQQASDKMKDISDALASIEKRTEFLEEFFNMLKSLFNSVEKRNMDFEIRVFGSMSGEFEYILEENNVNNQAKILTISQVVELLRTEKIETSSAENEKIYARINTLRLKARDLKSEVVKFNKELAELEKTIKSY